VATGGGGLAFELAAAGADVVGVDIDEDGLAHARAAAAERGLAVDFFHGDAQSLPFEDGSLDGVASAFGVIFARDRERAAQELARVCRPGGRLGLTLMPMDSRTGQTFNILGRYGRQGPHPASWEEDLEALLGDAFELESELYESPQPPTWRRSSWEEAVASFEPLRAVVDRIDEDAAAALRREIEAAEEQYAGRSPSFVIALGRRR
jgi:SAM-dependent methyltransferase